MTGASETRNPGDRTMGFTELKTWLRHTHPMVYLDRVLDYEPGEFLTTLMAVSGQTEAISGHFPERAVFPASHLIQAIAQSAIILFQLSTARLADDEITLVGSVKARFTKIVVPGDVVVFDSRVDSLRDDFLRFSCRATVDGKPVGSLKGSLVRQKVADLGEQLW
ncbi:coronafacic acid synthetase, dehydratase component (plasmid) [Azospirillum sp. B510]|uniref:3-hydroxyacyl-ACP dehydratase FabZ family protein n=1 Tax=Azospirillum sp. (strain B510) TaxID=137722 RepID=UPI0001C4B948|nr:coronafacic acid dehydratase [Azospirillum sp. B510]BAI73719.1 coronafacic acid synthetase, dehydratase component [Azospirillum sp. B510]